MAASNWRHRPKDDDQFPARQQATWRNASSGARGMGDAYDSFSRGKDATPSNWRQRSPQRKWISPFERGGTSQDESSCKERERGRGRGRFQGSTQHSRVESSKEESDFRDFYVTARREKIKRQYPISRTQLENLLEMEADLVVLELLREQSGFRNFLQQASIHSEHIFLVTAVLRRACCTKASMQNLNDLFIITCKKKFLDKLCAFCMAVKRQYPDKASDFFRNLHVFLDAYANAITNNAIDKISDLVDCCISVLTNLQVQKLVSEEIVIKYQELHGMLTEAKERWIREQTHTTKVGRRGFEMDNLQPSDNFRELPVIPIPYDFSTRERPFLRRNIVEGKYIDEEHYLDVQFRLLREDFVRPLRNGINDFKDGVKAIKDIRIYRNVVMLGSKLTNGKVIHLVKLNLPKNIMIQNSKRLLFGNLLCLTNDNFKSMFLASVAERNAETGEIGIRFETNISSINMSGKFLMVESRAYFMAYKHVLQALKGMSVKGFPMTSYIIRVDSDIKLPSYMEVHCTYDLRVVKDMKMMKTSEAQHKLFGKLPSKSMLIKEDDCFPELNHVPMCEGLESWPSSMELGLDESQCRALHGALTRELAIIQGPPGTGKTFIGLKITQILLHNSQVWKSESFKAPILVVCFTNHALDQFLEGMTVYTESIVRVGSRSKNEAISKFQVNNLARDLRRLGETPNSIHGSIQQLTNKVQKYEREIQFLRDIEHFCVHPNGIIKLEILLHEDIIPPHLKEQLIQGDRQMMSWLLSRWPLDYNDTINLREECTQIERECINNSEGDRSDDIFKAQEELMQHEEEDRRLDEEVVQESNHRKRKKNYELTFETIEEEMKSLTNKDTDEDAYYYYIILTNHWKALSIGLQLPERPTEMRDLERRNKNIWMLDFQTSWLLYRFWLSKLHQKIKQKLSSLETKYQRKATALQEVKYQEHLHIMRNAAVVGMTTTGAAQYSAVMQDLAPAIVIIEEAAEILESHVITSLTCNCQHLILIGDHQQLQPSATVYELATKYGLETSLFERMIKNGVPYECLEYQHRMRPSISRLLVPSIYPTLKDHASVTAYPHIKGVGKNMFFISHQIHEKEESDDNNSHENLHEAEFIIALCRHLLLQGYAPDEITILAPYSGQFFLLRTLQQKHKICRDVRISVVDNFQGEENKIILLSLVRSNTDGKVGFLRTENRVCVALSRAKEGLYIIGNMELLSASSKLWQHIKKDLQAEGNIGSALPIKCENHPEIVERVSTGKDFCAKSPEGGCLRICNKSLPFCDHKCKKICHVQDLDHMYKCEEPCPNVLCSLGHPCPRTCWQTCIPCQVPLRKTLPCGHTHDIPCSTDPEDYSCPTLVNKILPDCRHETLVPCNEKSENWTCPMDCDTRLDCGHMCRQKCHVREDPEHRKYNCLQSCTLLNAGCTQNHPCQKKCYEDCGSCVKEVSKVLPCGHTANKIQCHIAPEKVKCEEKCKRTLSCGHACKNLCYKPCGNCPVKVKKTVPSCQHTILIECGQEATANNCDGPCPKKLSCDHGCLNRCNQPCTTECEVKIVSSAKCPKNHSITMPCYMRNKVLREELWIHCDKPCGGTLDCGHTCEGKCSTCFQGRVHESCKKPCGRMLLCGHTCKQLCSISCPPCRENCERRCSHRKCKNICLMPCTPCKEQCERNCKHVVCKQRCGEVCKVKPCDKQCEKNLECGHPCMGFCGDPCPPLCRTCDADKWTDDILGSEHDQDVRLVLLEDCGHCINAKGFEEWLQRDKAEIFMKTCPKCGKPVYNNVRYKNIIMNAYKTVWAVKGKNMIMTKFWVKKGDIEELLSDDVMCTFPSEVKTLRTKIGSEKKHKSLLFDDIHLRHFQASVLEKASEILNTNYQIIEWKTLKKLVDMLVDRVMQKTQIVPQMMEEIACELERLTIIQPYWDLLGDLRVRNCSRFTETMATLEKLMDPTGKFDSVTEKKVRKLLEEMRLVRCRPEIRNSKRITMVIPIGLTQGQWYKCPNDHVFYTREGIRTLKCSVCGTAVRGVGENSSDNRYGESSSNESSSDESSSDKSSSDESSSDKSSSDKSSSDKSSSDKSSSDKSSSDETSSDESQPLDIPLF